MDAGRISVNMSAMTPSYMRPSSEEGSRQQADVTAQSQDVAVSMLWEAKDGGTLQRLRGEGRPPG